MPGGSSSGGSQTTTVEPPAYQLPYLKEGLESASGLFGEGGPGQYEGNTIVPFAPQTEEALAGTADRARAGSPVTDAAQNYVTDSLGGAYLGGNPWLDDTFNQAAERSRGVLESEFARGGRNINAAAPLRSDMLTDLASKIYGPAYESERNRQQGVLGFATPLAEQDYRDLSALRGVGAEVEGMTGDIIADRAGRFDYEQERPEAALDRFLGRVTNNMTGSTQTTPLYRNRAAGALGGALAGNQLGGMLSSNPYAGLIGAIGGGLFGGWG